jgi:hypothetical protein
VVSTFLSAHDNTSAVSDLRGWSEQQLIAAVELRQIRSFLSIAETSMNLICAAYHRLQHKQCL